MANATGDAIPYDETVDGNGNVTVRINGGDYTLTQQNVMDLAGQEFEALADSGYDLGSNPNLLQSIQAHYLALASQNVEDVPYTTLDGPPVNNSGSGVAEPLPSATSSWSDTFLGYLDAGIDAVGTVVGIENNNPPNNPTGGTFGQALTTIQIVGIAAGLYIVYKLIKEVD